MHRNIQYIDVPISGLLKRIYILINRTATVYCRKQLWCLFYSSIWKLVSSECSSLGDYVLPLFTTEHSLY